MPSRKSGKTKSRRQQEPQTSIFKDQLVTGMGLIAIIVAIGLVLPKVFPAMNRASAFVESYTSPLVSEEDNKGIPTEYLTHPMPMMQDEDGIWRPAREVIIDDYGKPIWIGGGLRKDFK